MVEVGKRVARSLLTLAVADDDVGLIEVDVLDAEPEAFHEPKSRAVHEFGGEAGYAVELGKHGAGF